MGPNPYEARQHPRIRDIHPHHRPPPGPSPPTLAWVGVSFSNTTFGMPNGEPNVTNNCTLAGLCLHRYS